MQHLEILAKAIRYQKIASDNAFTLLSIFQDSSEQMLKTTLESSLIPQQSKEGCLTWSSNYRQATETIKDFVDKGYEEAEQLFKQPGKPVQKPKAAPMAKSTPKAPAQKAKPKAAARKTTTAKKTVTPAAKPVAQKTAPNAAAEKVEVKAEKQETSTPKQAAPPKPEAQKPQESAPARK